MEEIGLSSQKAAADMEETNARALGNTESGKKTRTRAYRVADTPLEAYWKRNPIVVLHNVYMDQNQSCSSDWYGNKCTFLADFLYMFCFKF